MPAKRQSRVTMVVIVELNFSIVFYCFPLVFCFIITLIYSSLNILYRLLLLRIDYFRGVLPANAKAKGQRRNIQGKESTQ